MEKKERPTLREILTELRAVVKRLDYFWKIDDEHSPFGRVESGVRLQDANLLIRQTIEDETETKKK